MVHDLLVEAGGVVLDADGLPLFVQLDAADSVDFARIAEGEHGRFGWVVLVTVEDFQLGHELIVKQGTEKWEQLA